MRNEQLFFAKWLAELEPDKDKRREIVEACASDLRQVLVKHSGVVFWFCILRYLTGER